MATEASLETPTIGDDIVPESNGIVQSNATPESNHPQGSRVKILPRYLRASPGSCHDFCKYGKKHDTETKERAALRKLIKARRAEQRVAKAGVTAASPDPGEDSYTKNEPKPLREDLSGSTDHDNLNSKPKKSKPRKSVLVPQRAALSSKHNVDGVSESKSQNKAENVEPESATINEDVPEKTLYVIESTLENITRDTTQECDAQLSQALPCTTQPSPPSLTKKTRLSRSGAQASRSPHSPKYKPRETNKPRLSSRRSSSALPASNDKENGVASLDQQMSPDGKQKKFVTSKAEKAKNKAVNPKIERKSSFSRRGGIVVLESKSKPAQKLKFRRGTILDPKPETNNTPRRLTFRRVKHLGENQNSNKSDKVASANGTHVPSAESEVGTKTKARKAVSRFQTTANAKRGMRRNEAGIGIGIGIGEGEGELVGAKKNSEKLVSRHQNAEAGAATKRNFRRRDIGNRGDIGAKMGGPEKVVLRHQNVEGKKEVQSLFNNVIEETASKLVEARKSKVKALVGAFETVISLQDAKPSANAASTSVA